MTPEHQAILDQYRFISVLDESHGVSLLQHKETRRLYLKKEMTVYHYGVFEWLKEYPVKNTPYIYELMEDEGRLTAIEEYPAGSTLQELLDSGTVFTAGAIRDTAEQLCRILADLHSAAPTIIHRAVNPSNILIAPDGTVKLLEMNEARWYLGRPDVDETLIGRNEYEAPEQSIYGESTLLSDIYAVGAVMKRMLKEKANPGDPGHAFLENVAWKCAQVDPKARYQSAKAVADTLLAGKDVPEDDAARFHRFLPPGYRREHPLYSLLFTAVYIIAFNVTLTLRVPGASTGRLWTVRLLALLMFLVLVFFSGDYLGCQKLLGLHKAKNRTVRVLLIVLIDLILAGVFAWILTALIRG